jgi:hypothetical protein
MKGEPDCIDPIAVIKRFGRVPSADSFITRRTQGPGLASNFFYQITPEQVSRGVGVQ